MWFESSEVAAAYDGTCQNSCLEMHSINIHNDLSDSANPYAGHMMVASFSFSLILHA